MSILFIIIAVISFFADMITIYQFMQKKDCK